MKKNELRHVFAAATKPLVRAVPVRNNWAMYFPAESGRKAGWHYIGGNRVYVRVRTMEEFQEFANHMAECATRWAEAHGGLWSSTRTRRGPTPPRPAAPAGTVSPEATAPASAQPAAPAVVLPPMPKIGDFFGNV